VAAATLADLLVGDSHPPVTLGLGDHRLEHAPAVFLGVGVTRQVRLGFGEPEGKRVADALQLADPKHSGAPDRPHAPLDALAGKRRGEELAEAQLEAGDLLAQIVASPTLGGGSRGEDAAVADRLGGRLLCDDVGHRLDADRPGGNSSPAGCRRPARAPR
jgi:hypothetical protein